MCAESELHHETGSGAALVRCLHVACSVASRPHASPKRANNGRQVGVSSLLITKGTADNLPNIAQHKTLCTSNNWAGLGWLHGCLAEPPELAAGLAWLAARRLLGRLGC